MEEISLKEILQIIIKGKFIIISLTCTALIAGVIIYKLTPATFTTSVSVLANPINNTSQTTDYTNKLILPTMDIYSYNQQFLNSYTISKTIEELDLKDENGVNISQEAFKSKIKVENPTNTNILQIFVSDKDANAATKIANSISRHFVDYITEIYQSSAGASAKAIDEQLKVEQLNLDNEASKLRDYLTNSFNIDALNSEITSLIAQITLYKEQSNDLENAIKADDKTISYITQHTNINPLDSQNFNLSTNLSTREYNISLNTEDTNILEETLLTLSITDIVTRFIENTNTLDVLKPKIEELEYHLSDLQAKKAEEEYKYNNIKRDYAMAETIYETYKSQYRQALIIETSNIGNVNVKILADAVVPLDPSNKNLNLTIAISTALGLFIGIFIVLFKNYWVSETINTVIPKKQLLSK